MGSQGLTAIVKIRPGRVEDAGDIARLAGQLGYPSISSEIEQRLETLSAKRDNVILVAESPEAGVVGWIHIAGTYFVEEEAVAEIGGLVVDEATRSAGIGQALLRAAEDWAKDYGFKILRVHSNVLRERAHIFYERHGFQVAKQQKVFIKRLD